MTGYNHVITGAVIAVVVKQPALALPLAFASHFVLDAFPHYGVDYHDRHQYPSFMRIVKTDLFLTPSLIIIVSLLLSSWLVFWAMLLAIAPDMMWFGKYFYDHLHHVKFSLPQDPFSRFHKRIQWGERPWGWRIELVWAVLITTLLVTRS